MFVDCFISAREDCCFLLVIVDFSGVQEMRTCACNLHISWLLTKTTFQEEVKVKGYTLYVDFWKAWKLTITGCNSGKISKHATFSHFCKEI